MVRGSERDSSKIALPCLSNVPTVRNERVTVHVSCEKRFRIDKRAARVEDTDTEFVGSRARRYSDSQQVDVCAVYVLVERLLVGDFEVSGTQKI